MSSYRRWVKDEEDIDRLPHGMVRTAYDADTRQYTFFDSTTNTHYVSAPGEAYGTLFPAGTTSLPQHSRSTGRRRTLQAYDRPVYFADDVTVHQRSSPSKGNKDEPTLHHRGSTPARKHKRSSSFSDILPPHLIASASMPQKPSPPGLSSSLTSYARGKGGGPKSAPPLTPPRSRSPFSFEDEKKPLLWSPTADLPSLPPVPPPKTSSPVSLSEREQEQEQELGCVGPHLALRVTTRMLGRTLDAVKGGRRPREGQPDDDEWVVV